MSTRTGEQLQFARDDFMEGYVRGYKDGATKQAEISLCRDKSVVAQDVMELINEDLIVKAAGEYADEYVTRLKRQEIN